MYTNYNLPFPQSSARASRESGRWRLANASLQTSLGNLR